MSGLFRLLRAQYSPPKDPKNVSFAGKTIVLTGATSGLGFEAAIKFLNLGVDTLVIGSRSLDHGYAAKTELETRTNRPDVVQVWELEMGNYQSIKRFADRVDTELGQLDIALLNAGLWNRDYAVSPEGWEETLQVNTLSTTLLAFLLLPKLRDSSSTSTPGHLTVVSSQQFVRVKAASLRTDDALLKHLNDARHFAGPKQYGISKLLLEYMMKTAANRVRNENRTLPVIINTVSPGLCASSLGRTYNRFYERCLVWLLYKLFARTAEQGSRSLVSATYQGVESHGRCWRSDGYLEYVSCFLSLCFLLSLMLMALPSESAALTMGSEGKQFEGQAWREVLGVLREQAGEVDEIVGEEYL